MLIAAYITFLILSVAGLVWSAFSGMGTLLIFLGALFIGLVTNFESISVVTLIVLLCLFLLGEILEYLLVLWGARSFGSSKKAAWGALLGGIFGGVLGIVLGGVLIFIFIFLGIFLGGFLVELSNRKTVKQAIAAGTGGIFGRLGAVASKVMITVAMIGIVLFRLAS